AADRSRTRLHVERLRRQPAQLRVEPAVLAARRSAAARRALGISAAAVVPDGEARAVVLERARQPLPRLPRAADVLVPDRAAHGESGLRDRAGAAAPSTARRDRGRAAHTQ